MNSGWLFVHSSDELYGADRVLLYIMEALPADVRSRAKVWLPSDLAHGPFPLCERLREFGVRVDHVPLPVLRRANLNPAGLAELARRARSFRVNVEKINPEVVYGTTSAMLPALSALRGTSTQVILHNQEVWKPNEAPILGQLAGQVERIIAISQATRDAMPSHLTQRTRVVPNTTPDPTGLPSFRPLADLPELPLQFLAAGRWTANKGFDVLIDAWNLSSPGQLTIVGGPPPSGRALDVAGMVDQSPVADTITLINEVESIHALIADSHVVVMPSTWQEPFGLVALEGMSAGRPVLVSHVGGLGQFVNEDVGWLVPPSDPVALAEVMRSITHEQILERGSAGRQQYLEAFSPERFNENWRAAVGLG